MKKDILVTIAQGTLKGTEEEGMMTFYRIPYGTNTGRFSRFQEIDWEE